MGNSAIFQAGGLIVVVVEVTRKAYLASLVPVIVDAILNEHQVVADIVAFVPRTDFPRSRLGEKQRGKILAAWVTRKLHTIAQFSIRDPESTTNQLADIPQYRNSRTSNQPASLVGNNAKRNTLAENNNTDPRSTAPVVEEGAAGNEAAAAARIGSMTNSQDGSNVSPNPPPHPETAPPPPPVVSSEGSVREDSLQDSDKALSFRFHESSSTVHNTESSEVPPTGEDTRRELGYEGRGLAF